VTISVLYKRQFYHIVESNRIESNYFFPESECSNRKQYARGLTVIRPDGTRVAGQWTGRNSGPR